jgi:hypothetical protein
MVDFFGASSKDEMVDVDAEAMFGGGSARKIRAPS